jgi:hypothetical protein
MLLTGVRWVVLPVVLVPVVCSCRREEEEEEEDVATVVLVNAATTGNTDDDDDRPGRMPHKEEAEATAQAQVLSMATFLIS